MVLPHPLTMDSSVPPKLNLKTETIAGLTTFFTMAYIVIVNPQPEAFRAGGGKAASSSTVRPLANAAGTNLMALTDDSCVKNPRHRILKTQ